MIAVPHKTRAENTSSRLKHATMLVPLCVAHVIVALDRAHCTLGGDLH